ncbi:hypothetical protein [Verrucomicrobium sp. 3C]|uniref:hypothetical protein n=1 Tax=Verrucomicrobium sp. 3C TaxID=1134055 RepID=UPI001E3011E9|nr:hypothetical protein [Verrucomicrobium sp. 3C]
MKTLISELRATGSTIELVPDGRIRVKWAKNLPESERMQFGQIIEQNIEALKEALRAEAAEQEPDDPARRHYMQPAEFLKELRATGGSLTIKDDGRPWISFAADTPREVKDELTLVYVYHQAAILEELQKQLAAAEPSPREEEPIPLDSTEEMELRETEEYKDLREKLLTYWNVYGRTPTIDESFHRYPRHPKTAVRAAIEDMAQVCPDCARRLEIGACTHPEPPGWFQTKRDRNELRLLVMSELNQLERPPTPQDIKQICERAQRMKGFLPSVTLRAIEKSLRERERNEMWGNGAQRRGEQG